MKKLFYFIIPMIILVLISACSTSEEPTTNPTIIYCYFSTPSPAKCHVMAEATCTEPAYCQLCNIAEGEPLGHTTDNGYCSRCSQLFVSEEKIGKIYDRQSFGIELSKRLDLTMYNHKETDSGFCLILPETTYLSHKISDYPVCFGNTEIRLPFKVSELTGDEWKSNRVYTYNFDNGSLYQEPIHEISFKHKESNKSFTVKVQGDKRDYEEMTITSLSFSSSYEETGDSFINIFNGITDTSSLDDILTTLGKPYRIDYRNATKPYPDYEMPDCKEIKLTYYVENSDGTADIIIFIVNSLTQKNCEDSFKFNYIKKFTYNFNETIIKK